MSAKNGDTQPTLAELALLGVRYAENRTLLLLTSTPANLKDAQEDAAYATSNAALIAMEATELTRTNAPSGWQRTVPTR